MNIGFDLDEVFVSHPPLIPTSLLSFLYRGTPKKPLHYRMPGKLEQKIRILSHHPLFRPLLKENLSYIKHLSQQKGYKFHLVSSRFSFLKGRTEDFIQSNGFKKRFETITFNYHDMQPHEFKSEILNKLKLDKFVDDDLPLLEYLSTRHPKTTFYWFNPRVEKKLQRNIIAITKLDQML